MLSAKVIPPIGADTQFADMRAAYDALSLELKAQLDGLRVHHSIAYSVRFSGLSFPRKNRTY
jgi:alpha-ketoglutarate-dependent 2,4-dichlorophenoxyacetate dioxygenase